MFVFSVRNKFMCLYIHTYIHTYMHTHIHTYIQEIYVIVMEYLDSTHIDLLDTADDISQWKLADIQVTIVILSHDQFAHK